MLSCAKDYMTQITKTLECMSSSAGLETVYRDWCACMAIAISNGCNVLHGDVWQKRENAYLDIKKRYDDKDFTFFPQMLCDLTNAFEADPFNDYLGKIYMDLMGGNKNLGQCFTPINLCEVCALAIGDDIPYEVVTLTDECCGGGAMLIAACKHYHDRKVNYQKYLRITAGDLDLLCVHMAYVQLSLLGARAVVYHRNSITRETYDMFMTPMECLFYPFAIIGDNSNEINKP